MKRLLGLLLLLAAPLAIAAELSWTHCADENGVCAIPPGTTRVVRYGSTSQFVTSAAISGNKACTNASFGRDPAAGQTKTCRYSPVYTGTPVTGTIPNPATVAARNLPTHPGPYPIIPAAGAIIENYRITNPSGPCIRIQNANITIRDNEIGPCGNGTNENQIGMYVEGNATNITIQRNVIHHVASGVYAIDNAYGPLLFEKNYVYAIRGPTPRGQMIQFNNFGAGSTGQTKITCNISDVLAGVRYGVEHRAATGDVEDHINMYGAAGYNNTTGRIEIAYNRIRGHDSPNGTGSGIMTGDAGGARIYSHHNTLVNTGSTGFGIAGGSYITHDNIRVYMNDLVEDEAGGTTCGGNSGCKSIGAYQANWASPCTNNAITNSRIWLRQGNEWWTPEEWLDEEQTIPNPEFCPAFTFTGNVIPDPTLTAAIFDEPYAQCN